LGEFFAHSSAEVQTKEIGDRTTIWQNCVVLLGSSIGRDCNICSGCFIESGASVGDRVTIKNGVYIWDGISIGDDVFVGPNVTFSNDKHPISKRRVPPLKTRIETGVSIGAGAVILPGIVIGRGAVVGAGAVVTKDVPPLAVVIGNPARDIRDFQSSSGDDRL
jgi:acetyltransferase-like isoleucine patch superfamily enzyme